MSAHPRAAFYHEPSFNSIVPFSIDESFEPDCSFSFESHHLEMSEQQNDDLFVSPPRSSGPLFLSSTASHPTFVSPLSLSAIRSPDWLDTSFPASPSRSDAHDRSTASTPALSTTAAPGCWSADDLSVHDAPGSPLQLLLDLSLSPSSTQSQSAASTPRLTPRLTPLPPSYASVNPTHASSSTSDNAYQLKTRAHPSSVSTNDMPVLALGSYAKMDLPSVFRSHHHLESKALPAAGTHSAARDQSSSGKKEKLCEQPTELLLSHTDQCEPAGPEWQQHDLFAMSAPSPPPSVTPAAHHAVYSPARPQEVRQDPVSVSLQAQMRAQQEMQLRHQYQQQETARLHATFNQAPPRHPLSVPHQIPYGQPHQSHPTYQFVNHHALAVNAQIVTQHAILTRHAPLTFASHPGYPHAYHPQPQQTYQQQAHSIQNAQLSQRHQQEAFQLRPQQAPVPPSHLPLPHAPAPRHTQGATTTEFWAASAPTASNTFYSPVPSTPLQMEALPFSGPAARSVVKAEPDVERVVVEDVGGHGGCKRGRSTRENSDSSTDDEEKDAAAIEVAVDDRTAQQLVNELKSHQMFCDADKFSVDQLAPLQLIIDKLQPEADRLTAIFSFTDSPSGCVVTATRKKGRRHTFEQLVHKLLRKVSGYPSRLVKDNSENSLPSKRRKNTTCQQFKPSSNPIRLRHDESRATLLIVPKEVQHCLTFVCSSKKGVHFYAATVDRPESSNECLALLTCSPQRYGEFGADPAMQGGLSEALSQRRRGEKKFVALYRWPSAEAARAACVRSPPSGPCSIMPKLVCYQEVTFKKASVSGATSFSDPETEV